MIDEAVFDHAVAHAIDCGGHAHLLRIVDLQVAFEGRGRGRRFSGHEKPRAHGDAGATGGQHRGQATAGGKSAGCNHRHLDRRQHLGQQDRTGHAAGMAAALAALDGDQVSAQFHRLQCMFQSADGRNA
ncbi:hypothetical protein D3C81_1617720 [compost metagenome]